METETQNESNNATRNTLIVFVVIAVALIVGSALIFLSRPDPVEIVVNPPVPTPTPAPTNTPSPVTVYITGEVADPQTTHTVPFGSRVQDVVDLAGGFTENADLDRVNVAGLVRDGDQVNVPSLIDETDTTDSESALPTPSG
ncbi:MAG: SLBB domain-containing protein, partial [Chloroflexota bacterium]